MKRASLLIAALIPFAAAADQGMPSADWDYEQLRDNWRVSEIIGSQVQGSDGSTIGEVRDVLLTSTGEVASVLVEADAQMEGAAMGASEERVGMETGDATRTGEVDPQATGGIADDRLDATESGPAQDERVGALAGDESGDRARDRHDPTTRDDTNYMARDDIGRMSPEVDAEEGAGAETRRVAAGAGEGGLVAVDWQNPSFQPEEGVIRLDVSGNQLNQMVSYEDEEQAGQQGEIRASELLGMDVNLADEDGYGEVEDLLISQDGRASALVVDAGGFMTSDLYAVPVDLQSVNTEEGVVVYQLSSQEVEGFGEFDFDEYLETT